MKKRNAITVLLDESEFRHFEAFCLDRGHKKSTLIARLIREHLHSHRFALQEGLALSGRDDSASAGAGEGTGP